MNMHVGAPKKPQDSLFYRTDISPEEVFKAIGRLRKEARDEIDRLVRFLDDTDDHMEREPDDDEPSLGWTEAQSKTGRWVDSGDDREAEDENDEPILAAPEDIYGHWGQKHWADGPDDDTEDEHDGAEPDEDREPSLGSLCDHHGDETQVCWGAGDDTDREEDSLEAGIADMDGLLEQIGQQDWQAKGVL